MEFTARLNIFGLACGSPMTAKFQCGKKKRKRVATAIRNGKAGDPNTPILTPELPNTCFSRG